MRILGILALVVGAVLLISALAMDTTVGTMSGDRVNNIGLIAAREQRTIIAGTALIIGVLLV
ncbi:zinc ribbon domain-containing protein, partial [Pseudomonas aeruginosa]